MELFVFQGHLYPSYSPILLYTAIPSFMVRLQAMTAPLSPLPSYYKNLPKIELHRHLEGAIRFSTILEVVRSGALGITYTGEKALRSLVQIQSTDPYSMGTLFHKFDTLRKFYKSPQIISRIAYEAVEDAKNEGIHYLELRFTPVALSRVNDFPMQEVISWVVDSVEKAAKDFQLPTGLIASINRHESFSLAEEVAHLAVDFQDRGIVALDLAGKETPGNARPFAPLFAEVREAGLGITIHAGEWGPAENIIEAIELFETRRIGHGVRVFESEKAVALAKERNVVFEVCPISNLMTGIVPSMEEHPLPKLIEAGLKVTLNTDDPSIFNINLADEFRTAHQCFNIDLLDIKQTIMNAGEAVFSQSEYALTAIQSITEMLRE